MWLNWSVWNRRGSAMEGCMRVQWVLGGGSGGVPHLWTPLSWTFRGRQETESRTRRHRPHWGVSKELKVGAPHLIFSVVSTAFRSLCLLHPFSLHLSLCLNLCQFSPPPNLSLSLCLSLSLSSVCVAEHVMNVSAHMRLCLSPRREGEKRGKRERERERLFDRGLGLYSVAVKI